MPFEPVDDEDLLPVLARPTSLRVQPDEVIHHYEDSGWSRNQRNEERQQRRYRFDDLRKATYIRLIRHGVRRVAAAEMVGVTYATVQEHFLRFPEFQQDVIEAEMARVDEVEQALFETAIGGNVIAQQVILYNKRSDEWADQRKGGRQLAPVEDDEQEEGEKALDALKGKLLGLRERFGVEDVTTDAEAEPVIVEQGID